MNFVESFYTALDSLLANKMRSVLTMLGVIIGVASVIALMSIGNGVSASITGEIQSFGTNLIYVNTDFENSSGSQSLSLGDVTALSDPFLAPAINDVAASVSGNQEVLYNGRTENTAVVGVTGNYFLVNNLDDFASGDMLTDNDNETAVRVAVIGSEIAQDLFFEAFPVGKSVKINGVSYEVVGVLNEQGASFGSSVDSNIFIPLTTAQSRLYPSRTRQGEKAVSSIIVQAASEDQTDTAVTQITEIIREEHGIAYASDDDFMIISQTDLLDTFDQITGVLTAFLGSIAGISLFVGGIGIMNIMLVSVTERTREIGIRKAVGALKRDILTQFLLESLLLSLIGGAIGVLLGFGISQAVGPLLDLDAIVNGSTVLLATGFAAGIGLIFGLYPAWRAANLRPIEALRYE